MVVKHDMDSLRKVLVIIGTTGSGKTKLSVELAKALNGEIVNSDALQMYRGLDIATAKITEEERCNIQHHLLDVLDPSERCDVHVFKQLALESIRDILSRNKVPIIVGGTMYYKQSILWQAQLVECSSHSPASDPEALESLKTLNPKQMYDHLIEIDPDMAKRLHENNTRRVRRAVEIFYETGKKQSELIAAQQQNGQPNEIKLFDACALWVHCRPEVLTSRLEQRVENMLQSGLIEELQELRRTLQENSNHESHGSHGITQAIGFKEFLPYFHAHDAAQEHGNTKTDEELEKIRKSCTEQLNIATRQYARRQLAWIRNRFVTRNIPVYQLDSSDLNAWYERVTVPALTIAKEFLRGNPVADFKSIQESEEQIAYRGGSVENKYTLHICDVCGSRKFIGNAQWQEHIRSKKHNSRLKKLKVLMQQLENLVS